MFVTEMMKTDLIAVNPETKLSEARSLMQEGNFRHLPVVDAEGKLVGIVTDRDMRDAHPSSLLDEESYQKTLNKVMQHTISEIMSAEPMTVAPYYTLQDTLLMIGKKKVGALPVVDEEGHLKGIMSTRDLLRAFVNIMGIEEPGTLLCILVNEQPGQLKKIVDIAYEENVSLGSVLVARDWDTEKRAIFPYLLTNNVMSIKKKLLALGFELLDPMQWYLDQSPKKE
ncbi:MAG: CBS and ACT domain-containing protein [Desulfocapsaceae bacterium]